MVTFVDDSRVYFSHSQPELVSQTLSNHYTKIENYMNANKLAVNSDKTHLLVVAGRGAAASRRMEVEVLAGPDQIKQSVSEKLLGGTFQNSARWNDMISNGKKVIRKVKWSQKVKAGGLQVKVASSHRYNSKQDSIPAAFV